MQPAENHRRPHRVGLRGVALMAAAAAALTDHANAQGWMWGRPPPGYVVGLPPGPVRHARPKPPKRHAEEKIAEKSKPEGPLVIAISIQHQQLKLYDINGLYAEAPVSTGMPGHPTPMGVFSVLEKQRWHRSNIYSGAPMPYMQRITWSGVAIHEGVLPGYPASHGCIRMPGSFAVKMWSWTARGARVVIVPGEVAPSNFSSPKLIAHMIDHPAVVAAPSVPSPPAVPPTGADKPAIQQQPPAPQKATQQTPPAEKPLREEIRLATATDGGAAATLAVVLDSATAHREDSPAAPMPVAQETQHDEAQAADRAPARQDKHVETTAAKPVADDPSHATKTDGIAGDPPSKAVDASTPQKPSEAAPADAAQQAAAKDSGAPAIPSEKTAPLAGGGRQIGRADAATASSETGETRAAPQLAAETTPASTAKSDAATESTPPAQHVANADMTATSGPTVGPTASAAQDSNDVPTVIAPKRTGHVAVFISRKEKRLYMRQNFEPVFDVPVTIADPDKPLGTFVFTARGDKNDASALHWSVLAMPMVTRRTVPQSIGPRGKRTKQVIETTIAEPTISAADALERITIPEDALERIAEAIKPGGSIIVSDHGLGDETGEGTDFIVPLR